MTLEDRLRHFVQWLDDREVWLVTGADNALRPHEFDELIKKYVNEVWI